MLVTVDVSAECHIVSHDQVCIALCQSYCATFEIEPGKVRELVFPCVTNVAYPVIFEGNKEGSLYLQTFLEEVVDDIVVEGDLSRFFHLDTEALAMMDG